MIYSQLRYSTGVFQALQLNECLFLLASSHLPNDILVQPSALTLHHSIDVVVTVSNSTYTYKSIQLLPVFILYRPYLNVHFPEKISLRIHPPTPRNVFQPCSLL